MVASTAALEAAFKAGQGDRIKTAYGAPHLIGTKHGDTDFWYMAADAVAMTDQYGSKAMLCEHLGRLPAKPTTDDYVKNIVNFVRPKPRTPPQAHAQP